MDFSFTDEQQQLRRTVREFAESEIAPHVMEWDEVSQFPSRTDPETGGNGLDGRDFSGRVWRRGPGLHRVRDGHRGTRARRWLGWTDRGGAQFAVHQSHLQIRHARAAQEICDAAGAGQEAGLLVADRAASGFRRGRRADHRRAQGRRLDSQRLENVYHQWPLRGHLRGHGRDRQAAREPREFPR